MQKAPAIFHFFYKKHPPIFHFVLQKNTLFPFISCLRACIDVVIRGALTPTGCSVPNKGAEYGDERVCLSLCVCVCPRTCLPNNTPDLQNFCACYLRSSCVGVVICYALPVLWMTSYFLIRQGCWTSPPSCSAVHPQPWAWLRNVRSNTSCRPTDARDYFSGA